MQEQADVEQVRFIMFFLTFWNVQAAVAASPTCCAKQAARKDSLPSSHFYNTLNWRLAVDCYTKLDDSSKSLRMRDRLAESEERLTGSPSNSRQKGSGDPCWLMNVWIKVHQRQKIKCDGKYR